MTDEHRLSALEIRTNALERAMAVDEVIGKGLTTRLDKIEDTLTWLVRLIIGAIVLAVIGFALSGGFQVGG